MKEEERTTEEHGTEGNLQDMNNTELKVTQHLQKWHLGMPWW